MRTLDAISDELDRALRDAVAVTVGRYGGAVTEIRRGNDHDGDVCIYVEVAYSRPDVPVDPTEVSRLGFILNDIAFSFGERDFLYVHNSFARDQKLDETAVERILGRSARLGDAA